MDIGKKLKRLRLKNQLTLEELANRCELSKGFLSQVENNNCSPSISTLEDLLEVLGSSLNEFFSDNEENKLVFTDKDYFINEQDDYTISYLVPNAQKNLCEPIKITVNPKAQSQTIAPHEGEDFGYVIRGKIMLVYGDEQQKLSRGDSFYVRCNAPYYLANTTEKPAELIWISTPPFF